MSVNLIEMAKSYLTPDVVEKLAQSAGTDPGQAKKTMAAAIPSVLAGVLQNASGEGGGSVLDLIKQKGLDGSLLGNLGSALGGGGMSQIIESGKSILSTLFGGKLDSILNLISSVTGTSKTASTGLIAAAAPMVMNLIGKVKNEQGLSTGGLREMLMSQKDLISKFAPPGLAGAMGLSSLGNLGEMAGQVKDRITGAADQVKEGVGQVTDRAYDTVSNAYGSAARRVATAAPAGDGAKRAALIALCCVAALAAILWWRSRAVTVAEAPATSPPVAPMAKAPPVLQGQPISALVPTTLPSGETLQLEPGSTLVRIVEFIKAPMAGQPAQGFLLKEVTFDTGDKSPTAASARSIQQIAQILKAFPRAHARLRSYTATGADASARDLAAQRAEQVKSRLIENGVPAERVEATQQSVEGKPKAATDERNGWIELLIEVPAH